MSGRLRTPEEYIQSIADLDLEVWLFGERVEDYINHPIVRPSLDCMAMTYELAQQPEYQELMLATSHLTGEKVNRFTHIHQSTDDLVKKVKMQRLLGQKTGSCFQRCVGLDGINALWSVTFETDQARGTHYHQRFGEYVRYLQDNDLVADGAMTDPKGDRSKSPSQQDDPDMYLHIVARRPEGIVVRGAKAHQTGACNSHEILVMPTVAMRAGDEDYAVAFAVPANAEGLVYIYGRQSCDTRKLGGIRARRGQPPLRRARGHHRLRGRLRALVAGVHGRRDRVHRRAGRTLRRLPPAELRRVQGGGGRRADRRGGARRRVQRGGRGQPRQGQAHRDDPPQRDALLVRHRLLGRGALHGGGQLRDRPAAGERLQAERHPLPLRDRPAGRGPRRRPDGHHALAGRPGERAGGAAGAQVPGGPVRRADHRPHARAASDREPDARHGGGRLPDRVHARRGIAPGPAHHDRPAVRPRAQEAAGAGTRRRGLPSPPADGAAARVPRREHATSTAGRANGGSGGDAQ